MSNLKSKKKISDGIKKKSYPQKVSFCSDHAAESNDIKKHFSNQNRTIKKIRKKSQNYLSQDNIIFKKNKSTNFFVKNLILFKWIFFVLIYFFILYFTFSYFDHTGIVVSPRTKVLSLDEPVTVYAHPKYNQLGFNVVAISDVRSENTRPETESLVKEKASGNIKIFNNYSTEPQKLSPQTRFKSVSGKIFLLGKEGVVIPGKTSSGPGVVEVVVYAQEPGDEYNIDITDFNIPGFKELKLTEKYNNIYALSTKKFTGGFVGTKKIISDKDKEKVVQKLKSELTNLLYKRLDSEKTNKVILVKNSPSVVFDEASFENSASDNVLITQKAKIFALLVEKDQLERYLRTIYIPKSYKNENFLESFDDISFTFSGDAKNLNFAQLKKININSKINARFIWKIDDFFVESLAGVQKNNIKTILREFDEVQKAQIQIRPFWQNYISSDVKKISLNIEN